MAKLIFIALLLASSIAYAQSESPGPMPTPIPAGPPPMMGPPPAAPPPSSPPPTSSPAPRGGRVIVRRGGNPPPPPPPSQPPANPPPSFPGVPQGFPPGVLPPNVPATPAVPNVTTEAPKEKPKYNGTLRIQFFTDIITTGDAKTLKVLDDKKKELIETTLNRVNGIKAVTFNAADRCFEAEFDGTIESLAQIKPALSSTGVAMEMSAPLELIFRPGSLPVSNPDKIIKGIGAVGGVKGVIQDGNVFKCFCAIDADLNAIVSASGIAGEITSHEWISLTIASSPANVETALTDLLQTKYVLAVEIGDNDVRVLCVKTRVTRSLLKSILSKNGFKLRG